MPDLIGKTLGGYRIIEKIGLGGMATVFKAYQPSIDRYVTLKIMTPWLAEDSDFVACFHQEAKVITRLKHRHILPLYDYGEEDGYLYLVMRFLEGGTLKDRLEQGILSLEEARHVVIQVGWALEYAHQLSIIHRDLKPSNVLIDPQGDYYLTDFGIAKIAESTPWLSPGTPQYMAPECQFLEVDHRADIYSMGIIIYEMVTGQVPFDDVTPMEVSIKHITEPLPPPRSMKPDLPEAVERVIFNALDKEPADRYQSMCDLVMAFDQAVRAASVETTIAGGVHGKLQRVGEQAKYTYDVFISYSHHDKTWVQGTLLPRLEAAGLRVCIDYRDFEPGAPSLTEMERAVLQSCKTLLVLTPDYLTSEWARFENILAGTLDPAARQRRVIPLLLKKCELPLRIRVLIYIDFTRPDGLSAEWERLLQALYVVVPPRPQTPSPLDWWKSLGSLVQAGITMGSLIAVATVVFLVLRPPLIPFPTPSSTSAWTQTPTSTQTNAATPTTTPSQPIIVEFLITYSDDFTSTVKARGIITVATNQIIFLRPQLSTTSWPENISCLWNARAQGRGRVSPTDNCTTSYRAPGNTGPDFIIVDILEGGEQIDWSYMHIQVEPP